MSKELKPCPFCGEEAKIVDCSYYHEKKSWCAMCGNPSCFAYTEAHKTKSLAKERWNKRPIEEALQKRNEELEAENKRLREALEIILKTTEQDPEFVCFIKATAEDALKGAGE